MDFRLKRRGHKLAACASIMVVTAAFTFLCASVSASASTPAVTVNENAPLHTVPASYIGFSMEPTQLCYVVSLANSDPAFAQLFRNLGHGVIRVGGNTGDKKASWSTTATSPTCASGKLVVTPSLVDQFFTFVQSIGWKVMWQVPLDNGKYAMDAAEAAYVSNEAGLLSVEFGNEPNDYSDASTVYDTYISDWNALYQDYLADGGTAPVTGPAASIGAKWYVTPFLGQDASHLLALTGHYYFASAGTHRNDTCSTLLYDKGLVPGRGPAASGVAQAAKYGLPYIMNETNTYSGQGLNGVSNAFCSALWADTYSLAGVSVGAKGINFHGVANYPPGNSWGKPEYYTPINEDGTPAPEYYGMLAAYQLLKAGGSQVSASAANATELDAYAVMGSDGDLRVALVNRSSTDYQVTVNTSDSYSQASEIVLTAPSLSSLSGVTLGAASVASDGTWTPSPQPISVSGTSSSVSVPAYTAVDVTYAP
jgi:hypothetical protein